MIPPIAPDKSLIVTALPPPIGPNPVDGQLPDIRSLQRLVGTGMTPYKRALIDAPHHRHLPAAIPMEAPREFHRH
jgi:hypothetical protein